MKGDLGRGKTNWRPLSSLGGSCRGGRSVLLRGGNNYREHSNHWVDREESGKTFSVKSFYWVQGRMSRGDRQDHPLGGRERARYQREFTECSLNGSMKREGLETRKESVERRSPKLSLPSEGTGEKKVERVGR